MKVGLLQFAPELGRKENNIKKANEILKKFDLKKSDLDILILPEMIFTGYTFKDRLEIQPLVEDENGDSVLWAKEISKLYNCFVQVGFPRKSKVLSKTKFFFHHEIVGWKIV
ncbi:Carbon-nitrogen hydrolase [Lobulomyces angularis]|nr:Carbon-nitrogen hydrolase [Lobulomyces angularis]